MNAPIPSRPSLTAKPSLILVVDDESMHRKLVRTILMREGYEVTTCSSGEEALAYLTTGDVDLVILDNMMPGMTGPEILVQIRSMPRTSHLPVLMVTAIKEVDEQVRVLDLGANDFVHKPYDAKVLMARVRSLVRLKKHIDESENFENVLTSLTTAVEAKDAYTSGHSERVARIAGLLAEQLSLDEDTYNLVKTGGLVHDIGKLVVDLSFINKPGKLTAEEWEVMKSHPEAGARICAPLRAALSLLPLIRHHHERLNGKGYPDGLVEDQIPKPVRIISVADVYDALTTNRSYRKAMPHEKAMSILDKEVADEAWDAEVVRAISEIDPAILAEDDMKEGKGLIEASKQ
ncbi:MAG: response regulator [Deltaproteobacteria bacterium]|nr:response regulator [Deltaproteobacteria bacterium]